jgi:hypothetical protein
MNKKTRIEALRNAQFILINNFELTGKFIKNKKAPQNVQMAKMSKRIPSKSAYRNAPTVISLKKECADTNNAILAKEKSAKNNKAYTAASLSLK